MRKALTYTLALMLMACSSPSGEEVIAPQEEEQQTLLSFYVYAPEHPILTRANAGETDASKEESDVKSLQIWVFDQAKDTLVAYYETTSTTNLNGATGGDVYQIPVSREFANLRPRVDVYVLANVTQSNAGMKYGKNTPADELRTAPLNNDHFGTDPLTTSVPGDGLPQSGVLLNQPVIGQKPILRIGTNYSEMATVRLVRAVSKLQFVFTSLTGNKVTITGITLKENMLPSVQYLFLDGPYTGRNTHIWETSYIGTPITLFNSSLMVSEVTDPLEYIFVDGVESAQEYETRINNAVDISGNKLSSAGPYYLHESNKQLVGSVSYSVNGVPMEEPATFTMAEEGDFSRNHTWLVYAYYGDAVLEFNIVDVNSWTDKDVRNHDVYNW